MAADFYIKHGDRLPSLAATLKDSTGAAVNLTGATVAFSMRLSGASVLKVNAAAVTVVDATNGKVQYDWAAVDTDTPGNYYGEFVVTTSGKTQRVPNASHLLISVQKSVADTE